jgi:hypothetical protein
MLFGMESFSFHMQFELFLWAQITLVLPFSLASFYFLVVSLDYFLKSALLVKGADEIWCTL